MLFELHEGAGTGVKPKRKGKREGAGGVVTRFA